VLQVIADFTGLNIITSDTVSGNVTLRLKDVPWDQALDIILRAKGLDQRATGNVIWIALRDELAAREKQEDDRRLQKEDTSELIAESIPLNYLRANEAQALLEGKSVSSIQGRQAVTCEASGSIGGATQATASAVASASSASPNKVLSKRGSVTFDIKSNTLFVQETPDKLREIKNLLAGIDIPTKQVMIEARIVDANEDFSRDLGVRLGVQYAGSRGSTRVGVSGSVLQSATNALTQSVGATPDFNVNLPVTSFSASSIGLTLLSAASGKMLNLELRAMEADGRGKTISNPRIITQNRVPAAILQGQEIPYRTTSNAGTSTEFKTAVLCLLVDPQVLNNDNIILDVEVRKDEPKVVTGADSLAIDKKAIRTQVRMRNGETVVLGGIFTQKLTNNTEKVPLLGDIPILGHFFRSNSRQDNKTELLIFLTPRILDDAVALQ